MESSASKKSNVRQKFFFLIFVLIIMVNPFPLGSNRLWAWSFEAIVAGSLLAVMVACSLFSNQCISWGRIKKMRLELMLIGAWLLVTGMYLVPIPLSVLGILSPTVAEAYLAAGANYGYLSLDAHITFQTLMLSIYYLTIFILGVALINSRKRIKFVLTLFVILGVFEAVYGMYLVSIGQTGTLVQVESVTPNNASGTFINKNHLVAFLSISFIMGLCLRFILNRKQQALSQAGFLIKLVKFVSHPLRLLDVGLFLILAGIWNTHSRSGLASFVLALLFLYSFVFFSSKVKSFNYKRIIAVFAVVILLLIIVADDVNYLLNSLGNNVDNSIGYVMNTAQGRLLAFNQVMDNYSQYWFSGVGPGAYQVFFVNHRMLEQTAFFDHAHNDYIEFAIEYGLFSVLLLVLMVTFLYKIFIFIFKTRSRFDKYLGICVISSMIYMLLHGNMDFNARIPANVVAIILAISVVYGKIVMSNIKKG